MFIGAEITAGDTNSPLTEFDSFPSLRNGMRTVNYIGIYCSHEIIHWQQKGKPNSLLGATISEGAADFVGEKLSGGLSTAYQHNYGDKHQKLLWQLFKKDIQNDDYSQWLYNGSNRKLTVPADKGYYIGYKICEAYYNKMADKKKAI